MQRIFALVTVYNPEDKSCKNIEEIAKQVDCVYICDNSKESSFYLFKNIKNLKYYFNKSNLGLSKGFNKILRDECNGWENNDIIVFFDQDTRIPENHISKLLREYECLKKNGYSVGCIGPVFFNESMGRLEIPTLKKEVTKTVIEVKNTITSSMMCRYKELEKVGFWNEEIFLDMVDWDLCWRFRNMNLLCFMTNSTTIYHKVGEGKKRILGCYDLRIAKPFREYYQTRDCLYLFMKNYIPWNVRLRFVIRLTLRPIVHFVFLDEPILRLKYVFMGLKDFLLGVRGEFRK